MGLKPNPILARERLGEVDKLSYLDSSISPGDRASEELSLRIEKA